MYIETLEEVIRLIRFVCSLPLWVVYLCHVEVSSLLLKALGRLVAAFTKHSGSLGGPHTICMITVCGPGDRAGRMSGQVHLVQHECGSIDAVCVPMTLLCVTQTRMRLLSLACASGSAQLVARSGTLSFDKLCCHGEIPYGVGTALPCLPPSFAASTKDRPLFGPTPFNPVLESTTEDLWFMSHILRFSKSELSEVQWVQGENRKMIRSLVALQDKPRAAAWVAILQQPCFDARKYRMRCSICAATMVLSLWLL